MTEKNTPEERCYPKWFDRDTEMDRLERLMADLERGAEQSPAIPKRARWEIREMVTVLIEAAWPTSKLTPDGRCASCGSTGDDSAPAPLADGGPVNGDRNAFICRDYEGEIAALRAEVEREKDTVRVQDRLIEKERKERDALRAEVERLKAGLDRQAAHYGEAISIEKTRADALAARAGYGQSFAFAAMLASARSETRQGCYRSADRLDEELTGNEAELRRQRERAEKAERERDEARRLLGQFYDGRYGDNSDCEEDECEWCVLRRETWPFIKDLTAASLAPKPCRHEARAEKLAAALREIITAPPSPSSRKIRNVAARALADGEGR